MRLRLIESQKDLNAWLEEIRGENVHRLPILPTDFPYYIVWLYIDSMGYTYVDHMPFKAADLLILGGTE